MLASWHQKEDNVLFWPYHQAHHTPTCNIRRENRRQAQQGQIKYYVDGEQNRVVLIWLCGSNKESKRQELVAATHCIRPSDGWNLTTTNVTALYGIICNTIGHATRNDIVDVSSSTMTFNIAKIVSSARSLTISLTKSLRVAGP